MVDELNEGMPTGRKKCTLLFPVYAGKLAQMEVITTPVVSGYLETEGVGNTFNFQGLIKNTTVVSQVKNQGIGEQQMRPVTSIIRETLVTFVNTERGYGAIPEGAEGYMSPDIIKMAINEREAYIEGLADEASTATVEDQAGW